MAGVFILIGVIFGVAATWFLLTCKYSYRELKLTLWKLESYGRESKDFYFMAARDIAYLKERINALAEALKQRT
ncbi:MAG: hypothetical protein NTZ92_08165 [Candidatus Omnitrophica bacterium]|nr:hypothetical protein [Candidatus Omnitrophota bacterium]